MRTMMTEQELAALKWVRDALTRGAIKYVDTTPVGDITGVGFNMAIVFDTTDCGTVACIGGWMAYRLGMDVHAEAQDYVYNTFSTESPVWRLFFPQVATRTDAITVMQAVQAIDNFLEHGEPYWDRVLGESSESHGTKETKERPEMSIDKIKADIRDSIEKSRMLCEALEAALVETRNMRTELEYDPAPIKIRRLEQAQIEHKRNEKAWEDEGK